MPETCPDCGFPKAAAESDIDNFHRTDGPCFVATVLEPVGLSARMKCAERALARVKEERDQARSAAERHANRADDFRAKAMDTQKTLNCEIEAHDRTRAALSEVQALEETLKEASNAASFEDCVSILDVALKSFQPGHQHGPRAPAPAQPAAQQVSWPPGASEKCAHGPCQKPHIERSAFCSDCDQWWRSRPHFNSCPCTEQSRAAAPESATATPKERSDAAE